MAYHNYFLVLILAVLGLKCAECAEFVPVYMWGTNKMSERVPALHKISEDSFKDTLLEYLKSDPYIIVFAEHTLSPEDFAQHDQKGDIAFPNILALKKLASHVTYKPYVQNPIEAVKQLDKKVTELSIGSLLSSSNVPKNNVLIIDLNDAKDDEQRFHMLKRHDSDIVSIYQDIAEQHDNVLALYTAHHTSWVAPDEITHRRSRSLLADDTPAVNNSGLVFKGNETLLYLTSEGLFNSSGTTIKITQNDVFTVKTSNNGTNLEIIEATLKGADFSINFNIEYRNSTGYWNLKEITTEKNGLQSMILRGDYYAPRGFSYHCSTFDLTDKNKTVWLHLPGFQIQPHTKNYTFGDAYNCVGFTSVPIWSGLFVTFILLLIVTFGLTMMMDIKTMDRFDDPKGKTITVTAAE